MANESTIDAATEADAEAIAEVHVRSWRFAYRGLLPQAHLDGLDVDARAAMWRRVLAEPAGRSVLVARDAERVVGFCACGPIQGDAKKDGAEIYAIYVLEERAGCGDGARLIEAAATTMAAAFDRAVLWVLEDNARARRFYEKHGFQRDGADKIADIGGAAVRELRYARALR